MMDEKSIQLRVSNTVIATIKEMVTARTPMEKSGPIEMVCQLVYEYHFLNRENANLKESNKRLLAENEKLCDANSKLEADFDTSAGGQRSQAQAINEPNHKTWEDYRQGCLGTFAGGHHDEASLSAFQHGMDTVFNLLEREFPQPHEIFGKPKTESPAAGSWNNDLGEAGTGRMVLLLIEGADEVGEYGQVGAHLNGVWSDIVTGDKIKDKVVSFAKINLPESADLPEPDND